MRQFIGFTQTIGAVSAMLICHSGVSMAEDIPMSNWVGNRQELLVTAFNGARRGAFDVDINLNSNLYKTRARFEARVDLDERQISVRRYRHLGGTEFDVIGSGTATVASKSKRFAQIQFELKNDRLYVVQLSSAAGTSNLRIMPSTWKVARDVVLGHGTSTKPVERKTNKTVANSSGKVCVSKDVSISQSFKDHFVGRNEALYEGMYCGAVFHEQSVLTGGYTQVSSATRKPYTLYMSFHDKKNAGADEESFDVKNPSASTVSRTAGRLAQSRGMESVDTEVKFENVYSEEQLNVAVGGGASYNGFNMKANFDFKKGSKSSFMIGQILQRYYSTRVDYAKQGSGMAAWFDAKEIPALQAAEKTKGKLVYVSSVVFGRAMYVGYQHSEANMDIEAALEASYESAAVKADASAKAEYNLVNNKTQAKAILIGFGQSQLSDAELSSFDSVEKLLKFSSSGVGAGKPIAFVLRYVDDNELAMVHVNTTYKERKCYRTDNRIRFSLNKLKCTSNQDGGSEAEFYGKISVTCTYDTANGRVTTPAKEIQVASESDPIDVKQNGGEKEFSDTEHSCIFNQIPDNPDTEENESHNAVFHVTFHGWAEEDNGGDDPIKTRTFRIANTKNGNSSHDTLTSDVQDKLEVHFSVRPNRF